VLNIIASAMAQKSYNIQSTLYSGEEKARAFKMQATGKRYDAALAMDDAKASRRSYRFASLSPLAESGASMFEKYWPKDTMPKSGAPLPDVSTFDMTRYEP
jgi:hypothetical protein